VRRDEGCGLGDEPRKETRPLPRLTDGVVEDDG
jgi:hypothetical protein